MVTKGFQLQEENIGKILNMWPRKFVAFKPASRLCLYIRALYCDVRKGVSGSPVITSIPHLEHHSPVAYGICTLSFRKQAPHPGIGSFCKIRIMYSEINDSLLLNFMKFSFSSFFPRNFHPKMGTGKMLGAH